jgi:hypothetical protein
MADTNFLTSAKRQFHTYKKLGEKALIQVDDDALFWQHDEESNSIATIIKHMHGNMMSRWTDFRTTDGEKMWRKRDDEFENDITTRNDLMAKWEEGWTCVFAAIESMTPEELDNIIYIRDEAHTIIDAVHRQMTHYAYHVGQIVFIAKMLRPTAWSSLSIPRKKS